eukprot:708981-Rhodomonas_salina.1
MVSCIRHGLGSHSPRTGRNRDGSPRKAAETRTSLASVVCHARQADSKVRFCYTPKSKSRNRIPGTNCTERQFLVFDFAVYSSKSNVATLKLQTPSSRPSRPCLIRITEFASALTQTVRHAAISLVTMH